MGRREDWKELDDSQVLHFVMHDLDVLEREHEQEMKTVRAEMQGYVLQFREVLTNQRNEFESRIKTIERTQEAVRRENDLMRAAVGVGRWLGPIIIAIIAIVVGRL